MTVPEIQKWPFFNGESRTFYQFWPLFRGESRKKQCENTPLLLPFQGHFFQFYTLVWESARYVHLQVHVLQWMVLLIWEYSQLHWGCICHSSFGKSSSVELLLLQLTATKEAASISKRSIFFMVGVSCSYLSIERKNEMKKKNHLHEEGCAELFSPT